MEVQIWKGILYYLLVILPFEKSIKLIKQISLAAF